MTHAAGAQGLHAGPRCGRPCREVGHRDGRVWQRAPVGKLLPCRKHSIAAALITVLCAYCLVLTIHHRHWAASAIFNLKYLVHSFTACVLLRRISVHERQFIRKINSLAFVPGIFPCLYIALYAIRAQGIVHRGSKFSYLLASIVFAFHIWAPIAVMKSSVVRRPASTGTAWLELHRLYPIQTRWAAVTEISLIVYPPLPAVPMEPVMARNTDSYHVLRYIAAPLRSEPDMMWAMLRIPPAAGTQIAIPIMHSLYQLAVG